MKSKTYRVIGLMSGSSLDGLDIAFCEFQLERKNKKEVSVSNWELLEAETIPFSDKWAERLLGLPFQNARIYAQTDTYFGYYLGELIQGFLKKHQIKPEAIASHGHTIFHDPEKRFTAQIGNGAAIAANVGIPVIHDFRTQDIAMFGEGAPVAPIADKMLFSEFDFFINIGGIANVSCNADGKFLAFDIGGANQILNALANLMDLDFDEDGVIAREGQFNELLFNQLNELEYFDKPYPKSLSNQWVQEEMVKTVFEFEDSVQNKLRTVCDQIAFQTRKSIALLIEREKLNKNEYQILVTGGGALNNFLIERMKLLLQETGNFKWLIPDEKIILFKEAILMGLMGVLRLERVPNCLNSVTGALRNTIGGSVSFP
ncbi:MAG: anhydro-N-acetylmuramic acid kinase [Saprospiraceae bacterium]|jgi:anhydro-N-acetylmuramic acid kinase|nr:anhydro-N-acetylmuramic acid kinase [Saprospiraceae bacterium]